MKKFIVALMVLGLALAFNVSSSNAQRTITHKTKVVTASEVTSTQGVIVYKVTGYANATNAIYGLYNSSSLSSGTAATDCKVEGGEATQYDSLPSLDFGEDGLVFENGLTVVTNGAYVTIEYR